MSGLKLSFFIVIACFFAFRLPQPAASADPNPVDSEHAKWVATSLLEMQSVKPGMTREDLVKVFEEEGGLSTPIEQRYVYRQCRYMKVNVRFQVAEERRGSLVKSPKDRITGISQPFLEGAIAD